MRPRCSSDEHLDAARQMEAREVRHLPRDDAEGKRDLAALAERVHPEARQARQLVGGVELAGLVELGDAPRRAGADLVRARPRAPRSRSVAYPSRGCELAVDARIRGGRPALRCTSLAPSSTASVRIEFDVHTTPIGRRGGLLEGQIAPTSRISFRAARSSFADAGRFPALRAGTPAKGHWLPSARRRRSVCAP